RPLGRDERFVTAAGECGPEDFFGQPVRVGIGAVEHHHAGLHRHIDDAARGSCVGVPPMLEELGASAERGRPEAQGRHLQARSSQLSDLHTYSFNLTGRTQEPPYYSNSASIRWARTTSSAGDHRKIVNRPSCEATSAVASG